MKSFHRKVNTQSAWGTDIYVRRIGVILRQRLSNINEKPIGLYVNRLVQRSQFELNA